MDAWLALLAAVAGAAIALVGQYVVTAKQTRTRAGELILEQASALVALADDFRNRLWEERELGLTGRVEGWDLAAHRLAAARLRILCDDPALLAALDEFTAAGGRLGGYWRRGGVDPEELDRRWTRDRAAVDAFIEASRATVRKRMA